MGKRGSSSCLKIMGCVGDPADNEDLESAESEEKVSSSKRKWSFRKRSGTSPDLSNNVKMEPLPVMTNDKDNSETDSNYYREPLDMPASAKIPAVKFAEETYPIPSAISESEVSDSLPLTEGTNDSDNLMDESVVIVIQTAIRGYMAQRELLQLKNVIRLQAVMRGHLVRREAIRTLCCMQAIVKLQALVRARRMRQNVEQGKESSDTKPQKIYSSTEKFLANGFARQLLESTPCKRSKVIHISCDPSRSDSAWRWLERWTSVSSSDVSPQRELYPDTSIQEQGEGTKLDAFAVLNEVQDAVALPSKEKGKGVNIDVAQILPESKVSGASTPADWDAENSESELPKGLTDMELKLNECQSPSSSPKKGFNSEWKDDQEQFAIGDIKLTCGSSSSHFSAESDAPVQSDPSIERRVVDLEKSRRTTKRMGEPREIDGKRIGFCLRKSCNPAFAAVQSKFEELSTSPFSGRSFGSCQEIADDHTSDILTPQDDSLTKPEFNFKEPSLSHEIRVQTATSECGTEISISSTLDSPDRSEAEGGEIVLEIGALERRDYDANVGSDRASNLDDVSENKKSSTDFEAIQKPKYEETDDGIFGNQDLSVVESVNLDRPSAEPATSDDGISQKHNHVGTADTERCSTEPGVSVMLSELEKATDQPPYRSSPEGSPRSHMTAPESYGTPSSQVSSNTRNSKPNNKFLTRKQRLQLTSKKSPGNKNTEAGARSTPENLLKDPKNGKRRNSLGTAKPDHRNLEPRVSSGNSLPSYMQATQSARAKLHADSSPKSNSDAHDKDSYTRKRHSLPLGNVKQTSSPRMQRSASQVQQSLKGNGTHSPHTSAERKWQR